MKAIAVIGYHHTGKTTTVMSIVQALTAKGYKVATIKDIHSDKYRADTAGKNSALHVEAGSIQTVAKGLYDTAIIYPKPLPLNEILPHIVADYLIIEGMKDAPVPKLVCAESTDQLDELIDDTCIGICGLIANTPYTHPSLPVFRLPQGASALCERVLSTSFEILPASDPECCSRCGGTCYEMAAAIVQGRKSRSDCVLDGKNSLILKVGGKEVVIVPFVQDILRDNILAVLNNLRDIEPGKDIEIKLHIQP
ncbi:MAG: molybdopterin-guanine dinucleotide biosynthesis protein B [Candidatus Cloacimonetes bacterium]|jgi:molybdopterin-guanine dinucleotide biosynthesis protein B|nr:molybdopterin-guanine dinucleotide biosynthesis protein B [Candidatus Cloacimonadota bacterium]MCB5287078.1 molybdopterin-guanine dinucleotide biosynthesis protein B [Candidatus Cloacimonadota bacterium]MCK9183969.1 molybdopterin-guanine dinucleotide biosynthesis protein B [Candidatus Cloacimonadota bacterium]MCK9584500.1 molybdopterin-guanine dinucleotide biosynthesis protein B [Candidatus Cloacimonadota bacterium]MDY0229399.1 molybdopterin-guanine dinucleotide biosynthesis protein B [Candi